MGYFQRMNYHCRHSVEVDFHNEEGWSFSPSTYTATNCGETTWYIKLPCGLRFQFMGNLETILHLPPDLFWQAPPNCDEAATRGRSGGVSSGRPSAVRDMPGEASREEN
ncbi:hypothetical protein E2542_SST13811 [Spatholobus suberectus]|nr:hypothetical protein E2542_SST13811 [Spatholobus suberectus]